jgi:hypothetical protein
MDDDPRILEAMLNFDAPVNIGDCIRREYSPFRGIH